jgi:ElaB/YqjD/DUF883 family membrane-anchored ribosome-binding protein
MEMALFRRAKREDLASRLERKGSELSQTAAEKGAETSRRVSDILRRASEEIQSMDVGGYRNRVMDAMDTARVKVDDTADMARDNIRTHPLTSVAMALGIGILAGAAISLMGSRAASKYRE